MKIEEYKLCYYHGKLQVRCFLLKNGEYHGEYEWYYQNGQLGMHRFYHNGRYWGECKWYYDNGEVKEHYFFYRSNYTNNDHPIKNFPFLPNKPARKPNKSQRTRIQNLEI